MINRNEKGLYEGYDHYYRGSIPQWKYTKPELVLKVTQPQPQPKLHPQQSQPKPFHTLSTLLRKSDFHLNPTSSIKLLIQILSRFYHNKFTSFTYPSLALKNVIITDMEKLSFYFKESFDQSMLNPSKRSFKMFWDVLFHFSHPWWIRYPRASGFQTTLQRKSMSFVLNMQYTYYRQDNFFIFISRYLFS